MPVATVSDPIALARQEGRVLGVHPVLLLMADVSGYTRFLVANQTALQHSQFLINELMEAVLEEIELPLRISKVEGDALFLYAFQDDPEHPWEEVAGRIASRLDRLFQVFRLRLHELSASITCGCTACRNVERLKLKLIFHHGEALHCRVGGFDELMGVDVILLHRLLKNGVTADEYLLFTEPARRVLPLDPSWVLERSTERYEALGEIPVFVHYPGVRRPAPDPASVRMGGPDARVSRP